jgi:hypothetical protein
MNNPDVDIVPFSIEPLDVIEIGPWPAKAKGILSVVKKAFTLSRLYTFSNREEP